MAGVSVKKKKKPAPYEKIVEKTERGREFVSYSAPVSECPRCHKQLDMLSDAFGDTQPGADTLSVCINCTQVFAVQNDWTLRALSEQEVAALPDEAHEKLSRVRTAITLMNAQHAPALNREMRRMRKRFRS